MKGTRSFTALALLMLALLAGFSKDAFAQEAQTAQPANIAASLKRSNEKNKADFQTNNEKVWSAVTTICDAVDLTGPALTAANQNCINAAIFAANGECSASAKYFKRDTKKWQVFSIVLTLASAGFTGVGASATLANAKIYSTLGGTMGLGSLPATLNANANSDQAGLATVTSVLTKLQTIAMSTGTPPVNPTPEQIYTQARNLGAQCSAAATSSPASGSSTTPSGKS